MIGIEPWEGEGVKSGSGDGRGSTVYETYGGSSKRVNGGNKIVRLA